jgi:hypothetical protein
MQASIAYRAIPAETRRHLEKLASDIRHVMDSFDRETLALFFLLLAAKAAGKTIATKVTAAKTIAGYAGKAGSWLIAGGKKSHYPLCQRRY